MLTKQKIFTNNNLINFLVALIPLSLILGNLIININIILICTLGLLIYKLETFQINEKKYQYLIFAFFLYLIIITLFKNLPNLSNGPIYKEHIIKSFFFLRFLIFFFIINKMIEKNHFNINLFFVSCAFLSLAVTIDILIQVSFGKNIFGYPITANRPSGFFGSENIAGGYIQKFSLFFIFLFLLFKGKNYKIHFYILAFFALFFTAIILTGNRMPALLYLFSLLIFFLFMKKYKEILIFFLLSFVLIFSIIKYPPVNRMDVQIKTFYYGSKDILMKSIELFYSNAYKDEKVINMNYNGYLIHFNSGAQVWKKNKLFGGGLKSFRLNCVYKNNQTCNTHPHNYILEILVDTGIIGFILIYLIFIFSGFKFFKFYINSTNLRSKLLIIPFFLIVFLEFFPIRSSGSFFTTNNATVIFLVLAMLIGLTSSNLYKKLNK